MSTARVQVTYTVDVEMSAEEDAALDRGDLTAEDAVVYRALDTLKTDLTGFDRDEEIVEVIR